MVRKVLIGALVVLLVAAAGLFLWARAVFSGDAVRTAIAAQLSSSLGQPVQIGSIGVGLYPRVTVNLRDVAIGDPPRIHIGTFHLGTDFRALLSRRIEHARVELSGARIDLPLPPFAFAASTSASAHPPVEIVSIDAVALNGVQITSGGRTINADVEVVPNGRALTIRRFTVAADKTTIDVAGRISDIAGPVGDLTMTAGSLDVDALLAFANDFAAGSGMTPAPEKTVTPARSPDGSAAAPAAAAPAAPSMNLAIALTANRATMGALTVDKLSGTARVTPAALTIAPASFGVFGGRYNGSLVFSLASARNLELNATVSGVDVAAATAFAGKPGLITGTFSGKLALDARGTDAQSIMNTARGTARIEVINGTVRNLGLVRTVVIATSGRADSPGAGPGASTDEPFTKIAATLNIAAGSASTGDLRFESKDVLLSASGTVRLDGSALDLAGQLQLSDELSQQAGRDLLRYTQQGGRVTVPAFITGSAEAPRVRIDLANMAKRALTNRASEEAQKAIKKGLGNLLKK